ncbi:DUF397 domain-containing protein [Actinoallomurus sp. NPDC052274]
MTGPQMPWRKASYSQGDISNCVEVRVETRASA